MSIRKRRTNTIYTYSLFATPWYIIYSEFANTGAIINIRFAEQGSKAKSHDSNLHIISTSTQKKAMVALYAIVEALSTRVKKCKLLFALKMCI